MGLPSSRLALDPLTGAVHVPHPDTPARRLLVQLDGDALYRATGAFLAARTATPGGAAGDRRRRQALRGSRTTTTTHHTLLAVMDHTGHVLAQRQVADTGNEIPGVEPCWTPST
ncbi:hypothetical protein AB0I77_34375 [Streptomyces sp. NPDC050619]|uniref:hypothetical protein n=1 Tax=Streptomyces sp. NPDC050619 TaxID=3157214 RepID=UPI00343BB653